MIENPIEETENVPAKNRRVRRDIFGILSSPVFGICVTIVFALGVVMLPGAKFGMLLLGKAEAGTQAYRDAYNLGNAIFRMLACVPMILLLVNLECKIFSFKRSARGYLFCLPFVAVVINNLPLVGLIDKSVTVTAGAGSTALFIFNCIAVGLFEELVFRGTVLPLLVRALPDSRKGAFGAVMISSAAFGLMHAVNFISGNPGSVLMQIGYSFLIGAMCALALLLTRNIFVCAVLHAGFNFCGLMAENLGAGRNWDVTSIVLTAVVGAIVAGYGIYVMLRAVRLDELKLLYAPSDERK